MLLFQDSNKDTNALIEILKFIEENYGSLQCSETLLTCQKYFKFHANKILSIDNHSSTTTGFLFYLALTCFVRLNFIVVFKKVLMKVKAIK